MLKRTAAYTIEVMLNVELAPMLADHWPFVRAIYEEGIAGGNATFETAAPEWEKWDAGHLATCRFVAISENEVLGWAALSPVSGRCVYAGVAEVSVYVTSRAQGRGVGRALLSKLVSCSEQDVIWTLQAGIFPENTASIELHKKCGFRIVGTRERLGCMKGKWRDVVLMERRSSSVGV